jgi:hypothetical protein
MPAGKQDISPLPALPALSEEEQKQIRVKSRWSRAFFYAKFVQNLTILLSPHSFSPVCCCSTQSGHSFQSGCLSQSSRL